jgi:hypothetical protein
MENKIRKKEKYNTSTTGKNDCGIKEFHKKG